MSTFAQQHLFNGACPASSGRQNGDVISYTQAIWGDPLSMGGTQLTAKYDVVYVSTFGVVEVGLPGATGLSMALA